MVEVTTLFWDVGGVLLTNAWDHAARRRACDHFRLDGDDFERRHEPVQAAFETRQVTLDEYLQATVFYRPRDFAPDDFRRFMAAQSQACRRGMQVAEEVAARGRYLMAAINNESLELNRFRIRKFELGRLFSVFCSSCYLGVRKPGGEIFTLALELTQRTPQECVFIDDRPENLVCPRALGMRAIQYHSPKELRHDLARHGVEVEL